MFMLKVGHFTLDNASSNGTTMERLESKLGDRDISFDAVDRQIMCFGHVVELCSGRVVKAASDGGDDGDVSSSSDNSTTSSNPIAQARAVVRAIRGSGLRRDAFDEIIVNGNAKGWFKQGRPLKIVQLGRLQLLRDVRTRWDSVFHMLSRLREMRPVWLYFLLNVIPAKSSF
jgi:hypothetical protein